eukprot:scaffold56332_cov54-Phaeocystis_antarctica.AAC.2
MQHALNGGYVARLPCAASGGVLVTPSAEASTWRAAASPARGAVPATCTCASGAAATSGRSWLPAGCAVSASNPSSHSTANRALRRGVILKPGKGHEAYRRRPAVYHNLRHTIVPV